MWSQAFLPYVEPRGQARFPAGAPVAGFSDLWFLDGVLDPLSGTIVSDALRRIADELFEADWAGARARVGEGPQLPI